MHHVADARIEIEDALGASRDGRGAPGPLPAGAPEEARLDDRMAAAGRNGWPVAVAAVAVIGALAVAWIVAPMIGSRPDTSMVATPVRFSVPLPPNVSIFPGEVQTYLAASPDGEHVAFSGNGVSDPVWLHTFADASTRPIAGTEGARSPLWSPDGGAVAFFSGGQLKKVDVAGGPVQVISTATWEAGMSWSEQGTILFSQPFQGGPVIHSVAADGGDPVPRTRLDPEREIAHFWPQFLPDGNHFLYLSIEKSFDPSPPRTLYVASMDAPEGRRVAAIASRVIYVPPGYLLYVSGGTLVAHEFDAGRAALVGDPVPIHDRLRYFYMTGQGEFSASSSAEKAVIATHGRPWVSQLVKYDRSGRRLGVLGEPAAYDRLRISPDGVKVAVDILDPAYGSRDLWLYELDGALSPRRFTLHAADERGAVWSPDGTRIAYRSDVQGPPDIYARAADGSGQEEDLVRSFAVLTPRDWSADGNLVLFEESARATGQDQSVLDLRTAEPRSLLNTRYQETNGRFSPNGEWVAFVSNESGRSQVYIAPLSDPGGRQPVSSGFGFSPSWGNDGGEIYYLGPELAVMAVAIETDPQLRIGTPERLFTLDAPAHAGVYDVTADGALFLVNEVVEDAGRSPINVILNWPALLRR